jgi:hypothetical protein
VIWSIGSEALGEFRCNKIAGRKLRASPITPPMRDEVVLRSSRLWRSCEGTS